ncbi:Protein of unknown function [Gryllus bimaculatus]|nr:Protein of unknown function [Gryllus bimaculatus]
MTGRGAVREKPAAGDGDMDRAYWSFECVMPMLAKFIMSEMYKRIQIDRGKWQEGAIDKVQGIQTCCNWLLTLRARFPLRSRCVLIASASRVSARSRSSNPGNGAALDSHAKFLLARGWAAVSYLKKVFRYVGLVPVASTKKNSLKWRDEVLAQHPGACTTNSAATPLGAPRFRLRRLLFTRFLHHCHDS